VLQDGFTEGATTRLTEEPMDKQPLIKPPASLGALRIVCWALKAVGFASLLVLPAVFISNGYTTSTPNAVLGVIGFVAGLVVLTVAFAAAGSIEVFLSMEESLRVLRGRGVPPSL
jgi:hypothetical protein